ncbi:hypothetical protein K435DRAFT_427023 [Dendrothele bispora CBS 962.96]|uniref:Uncharacterized protein n=1 Tax=Dendrothele bispora (strain CBS 962.96) TaxID=1314807 RepID=A0A4S8L4H0_DENBC|nr:hypothetical protein K435DRAFT_427023 [Dendrothele bispora CBS 962.96]
MHDRSEVQQEQLITHSNNSSKQSPNVDTSSASLPPPPLLPFLFPGSTGLFLISKYSFCANETALPAFKASLSTKFLFLVDRCMRDIHSVFFSSKQPQFCCMTPFTLPLTPTTEAYSIKKKKKTYLCQPLDIIHLLDYFVELGWSHCFGA